MKRDQVQHPSSYIEQAHAEILRETAAEAEKLGQLHPMQVALIHQQGWFRLFVPKEYNGLELSLPEALHTEEAVAWADGSTGWTVTLCSGANWFVGFLPEQTARLLFTDSAVCLAGSGKARGTARITGNGYEVNGQWDYATGAPHATAFTANCIIEKNGTAVLNEEGKPLVKSFVFLKEEVTLIENWQRMGMIATASNGYFVKGLYVDNSRSFIIDSAHAVLPHPVFRYPFMEFAAATLAVNSSGMAMRFIDLAGESFEQRHRDAVYSKEVLSLLNGALERSVSTMQSARDNFYAAVNASWEGFIQGRVASPEQLKEVRSASYRLAKLARQVTDELYPLCGLPAANTTTEINRVWRNLHTASQHSLLSLYIE